MAMKVIFAILLCMLPGLVYADDVDRVRELRMEGTILPLSDILKGIEKRYPGILLEVELEEEDHRLIYEIEMLGHDQVIRRLEVDARSGRVRLKEHE